MAVNLERLDLWLNKAEDERLEFKEARRQFDFDDLSKYWWPWQTRVADTWSWA